ncbi:uncharacterized protein LOC115209418 isoform X1 [Argonauta hians]
MYFMRLKLFNLPKFSCFPLLHVDNSLLFFKTVCFINNTHPECIWRQKYLIERLSCSETQSMDFLSRNYRIVKMKRAKFTNLVDLFAYHSISGQDVFTYPDIFKRKYETVKSRIESLKFNTDQKHIRLWMINVTNKDFKHRYETYLEDTQARQEFRDRCSLLVHYLDCSESKIKNILKSSEWLQKSKLATIQKKLDYILAAEPELKDIISDKIWLLAYSEHDIENRIKIIKEKNIPSFLWKQCLSRIMKADNEQFDLLLQTMSERALIYGDCRSTREYLCKWLHCDDKDVASMVKKYPFLLSVKINKIQYILDFLLNECGFNRAEIINNPRIFKFSKETVKLRFYELQEFGNNVPSLMGITKDGKKYKDLIDRLNKSII